MAIRGTRRTGTRQRRWWIVVIVAAALGAVIAVIAKPAIGYASAGTAYSARVACSCHFVAGRSMEDCEKDQIAGMELVSLSADEDARSVTASLMFVKEDEATFREGFGCVLKEWNS